MRAFIAPASWQKQSDNDARAWSVRPETLASVLATGELGEYKSVDYRIGHFYMPYAVVYKLPQGHNLCSRRGRKERATHLLVLAGPAGASWPQGVCVASYNNGFEEVYSLPLAPHTTVYPYHSSAVDRRIRTGSRYAAIDPDNAPK